MNSTTMQSSPTKSSPHVHRKVFVRLLAILLLAAGLLVTSAGAIGASAEGCGEYSFGFTGTRLINDGISDSAGPFAITLPAGTYDVTMWSNDNHPTADYQVEQTNEQWYFVLSNGYQSPATDDIASDETSVINTIDRVELAEATSISVHHVKIGGVNSVNVECVGFTPSVDIAGPVTTTEAPKTVGPIVTTPPIVISPPATVATPPTTAKASPPTTAKATPPTTIKVEVKQEVEVPVVAQLAVTGSQSDGLVALGILLLALGFVCVAAERRTTTW